MANRQDVEIDLEMVQCFCPDQYEAFKSTHIFLLMDAITPAGKMHILDVLGALKLEIMRMRDPGSFYVLLKLYERLYYYYLSDGEYTFYHLMGDYLPVNGAPCILPVEDVAVVEEVVEMDEEEEEEECIELCGVEMGVFSKVKSPRKHTYQFYKLKQNK
jgi:hypothetical protein